VTSISTSCDAQSANSVDLWSTALTVDPEAQHGKWPTWWSTDSCPRPSSTLSRANSAAAACATDSSWRWRSGRA
jgi:hypothetical protein